MIFSAPMNLIKGLMANHRGLWNVFGRWGMLFAIVVMAGAAHGAASFSQVAISSESDILNTGTLISANDLGNSPSAAVINGIAFGTSQSGLDGNWVNGGGDFSTGFSGGLDTVLSSLAVITSTTSGTFTLSGLTSGRRYRVQLLLQNVVNTSGDDTTITIQGSTINVGTLGNTAYNVRAEFIATSSTEVITFSEASGADPVFNGYVLHGLPEIDVTGNATSIASGDTSPTTADHTDFASTEVSSGTITRTFTITNSGGGILNLSGASKVAISGTDAGQFAVTQPTFSSGSVSIVNAGFEYPVFSSGNWNYQGGYNFNGDASAGWTFGTTAGIARNGSPWFVSAAPEGSQASFIQNNTANAYFSQSLSFPAAGVYDVTFYIVRRSASYPGNDIDVRVDGSSIGTVQNTSQTSDTWASYTFYYYCPSAGSHTLSFVGLRGGGDYDSAIDNVTVTRSQSRLGPGESKTFQVQFAPTSTGAKTATLTIANDDSDEGGYNFAIQGTGVITPVISSPTLDLAVTNNAYSYTITATGSPTTFGATGLPSGLSIDVNTGVISGTPTVAGPYTISLFATNASTYGTATLTLNVDQINTLVSSGLDYPEAIVKDSAGNIYFGHAAGGKIQKYTVSTGVVSDFVVLGAEPSGLAIDGSDNIYATQNSAGTIKKITPAGVVTTYASGIATEGNYGLAFDSAGNLYLASHNSGKVRKITSAGVVSDYVSLSSGIYRIVFDASDNLYVANADNGYITKVTPALSTSTFASMTTPISMIFDPNGNMLVTGGNQDKIYKVTPAGTVTTFSTGFRNVSGIVAATDWTLYVTESFGSLKIRRVGLPYVPEIDVKGNGVSIASGSVTPSTANHTDFGSAASGGGTVTRTFTIANTGVDLLTLSGTPKVAVSGSNAGDFSVTVQPTSPVAATSGTTTFQVKFSPSATGTRSATLTIDNDDSNEGTYTFAIQGTGVGAGAASVSGTVSLWKGENNANDSVGSNHGTLVGNTTYATGTNGNAFSFDGSGDYVTVTDNSSLDFGTSTDFTLHAWVKFSVSQPSYAGVIVKAGSWPGYQMVIVNNKIAFETHDGSNFANGSGTTALNDGVWHHVAMVANRAAQNVKLYVDGVQEASVNHVGIGGNLDNSYPLLIGTDRGYGAYINGLIDEPAVVGRALSAAEIAALAGNKVAQTWTADTGNGNGSGNATADGLRIRRNGSNIEFSADGGTTWSASTVYSTTSTLTLTGSGANDTFVVDFSGGNPIPSNGVTVTGGAQVTTDKLVLTGGAFSTVTHNLTNATDGNVVIASYGTITYTGLEPVDMTGSTVTDLIFNLPTGGSGSNAILGDDGTTSNSISRLSSSPTAFESTDFTNPSGSLTINRGHTADTLTINATPDFTATLTVGGSGAEFSTVTVAGALTLASGKNFTVYSSATVNFSTSGSDVALSGAGAASITTARDIALASGASLTTVNGNLTLSANVAGTGTGNFAGINNSGLIQASGTGVVTLTGRGGNTGATQAGIYVQSGGDVIGGTTGTMVLTGTGGTGTGNNAFGIFVTGSGSTVTSGGAHVTLNGTGLAGGSGGANSGVSVDFSSLVSAGGLGNVTVTGTSTSVSTGNFNIGVGVNNSARISSSGGNVSVTGTGGGNGVNGDGHIGVAVVEGAIIDAGGTGTVSVTGTGGSGASGLGVEHGGIWLGGNSPQITSAGGAITLTGTAGPTGISFGIEFDSGATNPSIFTPAAGGNITFIADKMNFATGAITANNAANAVTLRPSTNGKAINLGAADSGAQLGLTDAELDRVSAGTINIGSSTTGVITNSAAITHLNANAIVLDNNATTIALNAGITTAGGSLTFQDPVVLGANVTLDTTNGGAVSAGASIGFGSTINLNNFRLTLNGGNSNYTISTAVSDSSGTGGITKQGAGTLTLSGSNSFIGNVTVSAGTIKIGSITALGTADTQFSKVTVASGAAVDFNGQVDARYGYTIIGTGVSGTGALLNTGAAIGNGYLQCSNIRLSGNASIGGTGNWALLTAGYAATTLDLAGFTLTKTGANTIYLCNSTLTAGTVQVSAGVLATVQTGVNGSAAAFVLDNTSGVALDCSGASLSVGSLSGGGATGGNVTLGSQTLTAGALNTSTTYAGVISGTGGSLVKTGTGTLTLTGANTYTSATTINNGTLLVNGSTSGSSAVAVNSGGTLGGSGTVGAVTVNSGGKIAPGTSPGILNAGNTSFSSGSTFAVEINGTTVGTGYDQLNVTGTVSLGSATLSLSGSLTPVEGQTFTIIANDGTDAVTGTFNGLAEGAVISNFLGTGFSAKISYVGGTGNDVVLTVAIPDINVKGNSVSIASGDTTPSTSDHTSFGSVDTASGTIVRTFTIENTISSGGPDLTISSITVSGGNSSEFTVGSLTPSGAISPGGSATFTVTFNPSSAGTRSTTVNIANNDPDETPYTFKIQGVGTIGGYSPTDIANLKVWFDADDSASITTSTGVSQWNDKSGNGHNASQGTGTEQPALISNALNGRSVLRFDGSNDRLVASSMQLFTNSTAPVTTFVVFQSDNVTGQKFLLNHGNVAGNTFELGYATGLNASGNFGLHRGSSQAAVTPGGTIANSTWYYFTTVVKSSGSTPANVAFYRFGNALSAANDSNGWLSSGSYRTESTSLDIGYRNDNQTGSFSAFHDGDIAEIIVYQRELSDTERQHIEYYLATKWALSNPPLPEINVKGNSASIASGDTTPSTTDHTDFGTVDVTSGSLTRTFTIENTGPAALALEGSPLVQLTGDADFSVTTQPSSSSVAANTGTVTFQITFNPTTSGLRTATVSILSDDTNEDPYTFSIQGYGGDPTTWNAASGNGNGTGNGTADGLRVRLNGANIELSADGGTSWTATSVYATTSVLTLSGSNDDDTFTIDFSGGNPIPVGGITIAGSGQGTAGDAIVLMGGSHTTVTYGFYNNNDGYINIDGSVVNYTGLEPITDNSDAVNRVFDFTGGAETVTVTSASATQTKVDSTLGESVTFNNPTGSMTVNAGTGNDTVLFYSLSSGWGAAVTVTINGGAGDDIVQLNKTVATAAAITVNGDAHSSGDTLNFDREGDATISASGASPGTITGGATAIQTVTYDTVETINNHLYGSIGDVVVADRGPYFSTGTILLRKAATGGQQIVNTTIKDPYEISLDDSGNFVIADYEVNAGTAGIYKIDRFTGTKTIMATNGFFEVPFGVKVDSTGGVNDGKYIVADLDADNNGSSKWGAIFVVDPGTAPPSNQTKLSSRLAGIGTDFYWLTGLAIGSAGDIYVCDQGDQSNPATQPPRIFHVDPTTGNRTVMAQGGTLRQPIGLAVISGTGTTAQLVVVDAGLKKLFRFTGTGSVLTPSAANELTHTGVTFDKPTHIALDSDGNYIITDAPTGAVAGQRRVHRMNSTTLSITTIASDGFLEQPRGTVVIP